MAIPPGVSESDFNQALQEFENIVGPEWVFTSPEAVALYRDTYSPFYDDEGERLTSAAVAPDTTEQVQAIMRVCNRYRLPIYPISTGKNLGYGSAAPAYSGSMVLDLKRMDRILEVDTRNHTVLVEPGVTFFQIIQHFRDNNLELDLDIPDPAWGSLIGHALDRGVAHTYTDFGRDRFSTGCGMEVVLANGELMRTGTGALENSTMWQHYRYGVGPYVDGIFSQSNFGVVTKMGFWIRPRHRGFRSCYVHVPNYEDLEALIDVECELSNSGINNGMTFFGSDVMSPFAQDPEIRAQLPASGPLDLAAIDRLRQERNTGFWWAKLDFNAPLKVSAAQWEHCQDVYSAAIPGCWFEEESALEFPLSDEVKARLNTPGNPEMVHLGMPSLSRFRGGNRSPRNPDPDWGHLWFAPLIPKRAQDIFRAQEVFDRAYRERGIDAGVTYFARIPMFWHARVGVFLASLSVGRDLEANRKARDDFLYLVQVAADEGWQEYRTPSFFQTEVMDMTAGFNDHALMRFFETLKDAVDPNGILSAGRYGIWPAHLREEKAPWHRRG